MGQKSSAPIGDDVSPPTLRARSLDALADYIKSGRVRKVVVMTGAGISTSAGIPDFRSPDTGLYANLARLNLPYAEAVFDISYFRENPLPFYTLAHELYPGKYRPTITHSFIDLLREKKMLLKCFTQNIDCLEREAGLTDDLIVEAHGSFAKQRCIECRTEYPDDLMKEHVTKMEVPHCTTPQCNGLVKPDIVFFGEQLPAIFMENRAVPAAADLCIVMGTSLSVQPFASLPLFVSEGVPRLLINKERVGDLGSRPNDVLLLGDLDDGVRKLAAACGWDKILFEKWQKTQPKSAFEMKEQPPKTNDEALSEEIARLTSEIDQSLKLSKDHTDLTMQGLDKVKKDVRKDALSSGDDALRADPKTRDETGLVHVLPHLQGDDPLTTKGKDETSNERDKKL